jgi:hypothetical protein
MEACMRSAIVTSLVILMFAATSGHAAPRHRLPPTYHWGRCLLIVDGQTRISGACAYELREHGSFYITGPHQVYEGIDFQNPDHSGAGDQSRDYWAVINREDDGTWTGYGNDDIRATHGDTHYGTLTHQDACFAKPADNDGPAVRVCLWRG